MIKKSYIHFWLKMTPSPKNGHDRQKFFPLFSQKMLLSSKKLLDEKTFKTLFLIKKGYFHFGRETPRGTWLHETVFHRFLEKYGFF